MARQHYTHVDFQAKCPTTLSKLHDTSLVNEVHLTNTIHSAQP